MDQLAEKIMEDFRQYHSIQSVQMDAIETEAHPDIARFTFERSAAFENLKNHLTLLLKMVNSADKVKYLHLATTCQDEVARLLARDEILADRIREYRDHLKGRMASLNRGRRVLKGYGQGGSGASATFVHKSG